MGFFINTESVHNTKDITSVVTEAYFGDQILSKAQEYLSAFRADIIKSGGSRGTFTNKNRIAFNREMEKIFGFYVFDLCVHIDNKYAMWTIPLGTKIGYDLKNKNKCTFDNKRGYRFDPNLEYCCTVNITVPILLDKSISDREVMAGILHEVGHNFQQVAIDYEGKAGCIFNIVLDYYLAFVIVETIVDQLVGYAKIDSTKNPNLLSTVGGGMLKANNYVEKAYLDAINMMGSRYPKTMRELDDINSMISTVLIVVKDCLDGFKYIKSIFKLAFTPGLYAYEIFWMICKKANPLGLLGNKVSYDTERFADQFAAMYGYGIEDAGYIDKVTNKYGNSTIENVLANDIAFGYLVNAVIAPLKMLNDRLDSHSYDRERMSYILEYLDEEISNTGDPRMKQYLKKQKAQIARLIDDHKNVRLDYQKPHVVRIALDNIIDELLGDHNDLSKTMYGKSQVYKLTDKKFKK